MVNEVPPPPVIIQDPAQCWAAAFTSWDRSIQECFGLRPGPDAEQLIAWLGRGNFLTRAGRATDAGVDFLGNLGLMRLTRYQGWEVMPKMLGRHLEHGPVFCAYYWQTRRAGRVGHAVVIYRVTSERIYFMDPAPGRGLVKESASFFARESATVLLGTSLLAEFFRA